MRLLAIIVISYASAVFTLAHRFGAELPTGFVPWWTATILVSGCSLLVAPVRQYVTTISHDPRPFVVRVRDSWKQTRRHDLTGKALAERAASVLLIAGLLGAFGIFKPLIPLLHPYSFDARIAQLSQQLHGGRPAYTYLKPILRSSYVVRGIDLLYYWGWVLLLWGVFIWQVGARAKTRCQYLVTFALVWVLLGSVIATIFSSAGPAFYGHVVRGANPYASLVRQLEAIDRDAGLIAVDIQHRLWLAYSTRQPFAGSGISAFPSIHVAMAELTAIVGRRSGSRVTAIGLTVFSLATLVGSVCLGLHYMIDGLASGIAVHALWRASGWTLTRYNGRSTTARPKSSTRHRTTSSSMHSCSHL